MLLIKQQATRSVSLKESVPLKQIHVDARLRSFAADVTLTQVFQNDESVPIEAVYCFPVEENAAVYAFVARIDNEREIVAELKEKKTAQKEYTEALAQGHGAYLFEQDEASNDIFVVSVGALQPGSECCITISYVSELDLLHFDEKPTIRFVIPTTIAPRYSPAETGITSPVNNVYAQCMYLNVPSNWNKTNLTTCTQTIEIFVKRYSLLGYENMSHHLWRIPGGGGIPVSTLEFETVRVVSALNGSISVYVTDKQGVACLPYIRENEYRLKQKIFTNTAFDFEYIFKVITDNNRQYLNSNQCVILMGSSQGTYLLQRYIHITKDNEQVDEVILDSILLTDITRLIHRDKYLNYIFCIYLHVVHKMTKIINDTFTSTHVMSDIYCRIQQTQILEYPTKKTKLPVLLLHDI
ncbi:unnamed protein product [Rotaria sp. Silwood1]|nr:unnamed protein product [Rotaria sp. Silwood1]